MLKKIYFILLVSIQIQSLFAQQNLGWATKISPGGCSWGISSDLQSNVYTIGVFGGTCDFDPGAGISNITSYGLMDIFINKLDANGNFIWAQQLGGTGYEVGYAITTDKNFNVYTTGFFQATGDFDPGPSVFNLTPIGSADLFVSKLNSSGNFVWAKQIEGGSVESNSIFTDDSGNVYIT